MLKKYMTFCAISMIAFSSCQDQISISDNNEETPDKGAEEVVYPIEKTFYSVDGFSKTLLNNTQVLWERGDKINIFWSDGDGGMVSAEANPYNFSQEARFDALVSEEAQTFYAVHPYSDAASLSDGKITVVVPSVQDGTFSSASIAAARADVEDHLAFKHMVSFVEFTIDKCGTLTFSCGPDIAGNVAASFNDNGGLQSYTQTGSGDAITIDIPCSGTYYIALLPDVEMDFLSFTLTNGSTTEYILSTKSKTMTRGKLIGLGNITDRFSNERHWGATTEDFTIVDFDGWF
jgi:hypothetical protein